MEDASYGFGSAMRLWPASLLDPRPGTWAVLRWRQKPEEKSSSAVLDYLAEKFRDRERSDDTRGDRTILIESADDLRMRQMRISRELAWERAIEDLAEGLRTQWSEYFGKCKYLVVSFAGAGAAVFARTDSNGFEGRLYFDPLRLQETWAQEYQGSMFGYTRCVTTAVTLQLLRVLAEQDNPRGFDPSALDVATLGKAIMPALHAQHVLLRTGFDPTMHSAMDIYDDSVPYLDYPFESVAVALALPFKNGLPERKDSLGNSRPPEHFDRRYVELPIPDHLDGKPADTDHDKWKIVRRQFVEERDVLLEAKRIVEFGVEGAPPLYEYPLARFGTLLLTDRTEIESFSSVASLITNYMHVRRVQKPLSIALFGDPGSGKSFGITEVATHVAKRLSRIDSDHALRAITFNLSQLSSPSAIIDALHQVRDAGLSRALPLVFWDEFDTALNGVDLGWLRYFLAPMEDGTFQEGPMTHNIGRAIFIFGGGTYRTMNAFKKMAHATAEAGNKASDFVSRLSGHVDVLGLDYPDRDKVDPSIALRRAGLLHTLLKNCDGDLEQTIFRNDRLQKIMNVDPGLTYAFLRIQKYDYAARSMRAIVRMSGITGRAMFERSNLAPSEQMRTHVDARVSSGCWRMRPNGSSRPQDPECPHFETASTLMSRVTSLPAMSEPPGVVRPQFSPQSRRSSVPVAL